MFSFVEAEELTGIFLNFDKKRSVVTILTRQGNISLKVNENTAEILKSLRQGYIVKVSFVNKVLKEIKLEEKPQ